MYHRFNENKYPSTNIQMDVFKNHIEIIENNEAGFAFPSQSLYVEKLSDDKTEIFNPQSIKK